MKSQSKLFASEKQSRLFLALSWQGPLIFACGPEGISVNVYGHWSVRHFPEMPEDRLEVDDGTQHVHVTWARVKRVEHAIFRGEGMLTFLAHRAFEWVEPV